MCVCVYIYIYESLFIQNEYLREIHVSQFVASLLNSLYIFVCTYYLFKDHLLILSVVVFCSQITTSLYVLLGFSF